MILLTTGLMRINHDDNESGPELESLAVALANEGYTSVNRIKNELQTWIILE